MADSKRPGPAGEPGLKGQQVAARRDIDPIKSPSTEAQRTPERPHVTPFYVATARALDQRIRSLRWSMQETDDRSGLQDGFTSKLLHPLSPNGRQVNWTTLQLLVTALWPHGVRVTITGLPAPAGITMHASAGTHKPTPPRATMHVPTPEEASDMARRRMARLTDEAKSKLGRRAARARWRRVRQDRAAMNVARHP